MSPQGKVMAMELRTREPIYLYVTITADGALVPSVLKPSAAILLILYATKRKFSLC